jgi:hypothetical protein
MMLAGRFGMFDVASTPMFEDAGALLATKPARPLMADVLTELEGKETVPAETVSPFEEVSPEAAETLPEK